MRIGEVARRSGVSARMLRHYETLGLVTPTGRTSSGYRDYLPADLARIFHVESLRSMGLSLREVGRALDDPDFAPDALVTQLAERTAAQIAEGEQLLRRLNAIAERGLDDWDNVLSTIALLEALSSPNAGRRQRAALTATGRTAPTSALVESLLHEDEPNVAGALRWALVRAGDAVPLLAEAARRSDVRERTRAVLALTEIAGPASTAALTVSVSDPNHEIRASAALELCRRGQPPPPDVLIGLIVDGIRDVDAADALAVAANSELPEQTVAFALIAKLSDANPGVRRRITQALGELPGAAAQAALAALVDDEDEQVARTAAYLRRPS
ncbi:MAG: MerR family transcriptional regulator [Gordonia sp. (in: high G+C Gram-positive bacteria)]|uniref:MerR family transcriptional regulator n=1 Tax=Gordonia sp. (in: high G+C Gram-positive bacteria) TaxID=84139 RepID=UPI003C710706